MTASTTDSTKRYPAFLPQAAADVVGLVLLILLFDPFQNLYVEQFYIGGGLLLVLYLMFCFGVNFLRKLRPVKASEPWGPLQRLDFTRSKTATVLVTLVMVVFSLFVQVDLNQFVNSMSVLGGELFLPVHEGEVSMYFAFGPSFLWIVITLFYMVVMITKVEANADPFTTRYAVREFLGLGSINLLLVAYAAYLGLAWSGSWLIWLAFPLLLIIFGAPRLVDYLKNPQWVGLFTFLALLLAAFVRLLLT